MRRRTQWDRAKPVKVASRPVWREERQEECADAGQEIHRAAPSEVVAVIAGRQGG